MERSIRLLVTLLAVLFTGVSTGQGLPSGSPIKPAIGWRPEPAAVTPPVHRNPDGPGKRSQTPLPGQDGFYDTTNPAFQQLQKANQSLAGMPLDKAGFVDWMRLLKEQRIAPRANLAGSDSVSTLDLDVTLKNTKQMPWVRFPHLSHTAWLDCSNCHPAPFEQKAGTARISMESIFRGQWCGMCHDRVAFITHFACERCHSVPNAAAATGE
ncbi:MAG: hypothetical protein E6R14_09435 [Thermomicrobiales bacterium]|jgi:c(7)-type cytochrome triheme protein|nr:MAG: hypothetical protein E6R14_09435 [Thermomicrobiales bacterium]